MSSASLSWTTPKSCCRTYLRFVRGIIDSEDLPLNVSREILQQNRILTSIRTASVKKVLSELKTIASDTAGAISEVHRAVQPPAQRRLVRRLRQPRSPAGSGPVEVDKGGRPDQPGGRKVAHEGRAEGHLLHDGRRGFPAAHFAAARNLQEKGHRGAAPR